MVNRIIYLIAWTSARLFAMLYLRLRIKGAHHLPKTGPVLIVANHSSNLDPPLVAVSFTQRRLRFLGKKELWNNRLFGWILTALGSLPVDRSAASDRGAIKASLECLKNGEPLLVFPEGTRTSDGTLQPFRDGPARIALMVPGTLIVPLRLHGAFEAWGRGTSFPKPHRVTVVVGEPFDPSSLATGEEGKKSLYRAVTNEMFTRISNL
ncbi:MAG: 1-acyl-sn-glycerol-3-phosphate acyltransferase [Candidatus Sumerlaeota bacterium]|nr:1-acyl-sn-glycerol-3-phosphate acyltransferase [Candidatus Sumerlaeota bacterium]